MEYDKKTARRWYTEVMAAFPALEKGLHKIPNREVLLIGAAVIELYHELGWTASLTRATGDIDVSMGVPLDEEKYTEFGKYLRVNGYTRNSRLPYRYYPPRPSRSSKAYLDLLAHPSDSKVTDAYVQNLIGVGTEFTFETISFALTKPLHIIDKIYFPNPLGFLSLKRVAYRNDPGNRVKDLADVVELASGLVNTGTHFKLSDLWSELKKSSDAEEVKKMLIGLMSDDNVEWDLEYANQEFLNRGFSSEDVTTTFPRNISELVDQLK